MDYQDTLFVNAGTQYYRDCQIAGEVDFIFGTGQAVFDRCDIVSLDRGSPTNNGYLHYRGEYIDRETVRFDCRLLKGSEKMADRSVALGRPWHPSADPKAVGHVAFLRCYMGYHILVLKELFL